MSLGCWRIRRSFFVINEAALTSVLIARYALYPRGGGDEDNLSDECLALRQLFEYQDVATCCILPVRVTGKTHNGSGAAIVLFLEQFLRFIEAGQILVVGAPLARNRHYS